MNLVPADPITPVELFVVGELRADPLSLLLLGADSRFYSYSIVDGVTVSIEPGQEWDIDYSSVAEIEHEIDQRQTLFSDFLS
jgi:hypothetical protein